MLFSGCDMGVLQMNSQQLWLSKRDPHKRKAIKSFQHEVGEAPILAEQLLDVDGAEAQEPIFQKFGHWQVSHAPVGNHTYIHIRVVTGGFSGLNK